MTLACCLVLAARAPNPWERSRNVAWNQWFHKLSSYRGLMGRATEIWPAQRECAEEYMGERERGVSGRRVDEGGTHRKRREVCATRDHGHQRVKDEGWKGEG